jgi:predicted NUDIX family phosphoesterase
MAFKDDLKGSLELAVFEGGVGQDKQAEEPSNVVQLGVERLLRNGPQMDAKDATPLDVIRLVEHDIIESGNVTACYVTLITNQDNHFEVTNYRSNLARTEEIAYRQMGVQQAIENWKLDAEEV